MKAAKKRRTVHRSPRRPMKKRIWVVSMGERLRIIADYAQGGADNTIVKLAEKYKRDRETISRIVKSPEAEQAGKVIMTQLLEDALDGVAERIAYEVKNKATKNGAWMAMELAEKFGGIPNGRVKAPEPPTTPEEGDKRVKSYIERLTAQAMERGKVFGMPMPELEEHETEIRLDGK